MFWVETAPTPAVACAHRAATAGLEDETATPNIPVLLHRPTIEKVIGVILANFVGPNYLVQIHTFLDERHPCGQIRRSRGDLKVAIAPKESLTKMGARA